MSTLPTSPTPKPRSQTADGNLIGLLTVSFYVLFTLLPSSHSLMVSWPWVAVWQVALALPIIWLLWQLWFKPLASFKLGSGLDWPIALLVIGLGVSTLFAEFPNQALWYSWAALGGIAALYALSGWLKTTQQAMKLLKFQASLGIAFILVSFGLWVFQTYLPELERLATLEPYGVSQQFNFGITSLRNWYPLGHQNYVAGYLVLILPLLFGLAISDKGWQRWLWGSGCCFGLVDLYTASSRGGLIALVITVAIALVIILFRSQLPRRLVLPAGGLLLCLLIAVTFSNSRVRQPLLALIQGRTSSSELGYRIITNTIGWHMGIDYPLTGVGPGGVLQLYQKYRPYWAGREAELHFQLHSTPAQLWSELGLWGIGAMLSLIGLLCWLTWRWSSRPTSHSFLNPILVWSLLASLLAYGLMGLTDYQLDVIAISGVLLVYLAVLAQVYYRGSLPKKNNKLEHSSPIRLLSRFSVGIGIGVFTVTSLWLVPVHWAWAISKQGFDQLNRGNFDQFETSLIQAHRLTPWEPYYPSILAWTLGDYSFQTTGASREALRAEAIDWFKQANTLAPYQEFGQSNLGWLLIQTSPEQAVEVFVQATQLVPAKRGTFLGLGLSLLRDNQPDLATEAFVLELLRFPLQVTSPLWTLGETATVRETVLKQLASRYEELIQTDNPSLQTYFKVQQGALQWWRGDYGQAAKSWTDFSTGQALLQLAQGESIDPNTLPATIIGRQAMLAWLLPEQRRELLEKTLITPRNELPQFNTAPPDPDQVKKLVTTMDQATSFDAWLQNNNLMQQPRSQRTGFGTIYRHIDGPLPLDYAPRIVNLPVSQNFEALFFSRTLFPELDRVLQPQRKALIDQLRE